MSSRAAILYTFLIHRRGGKPRGTNQENGEESHRWEFYQDAACAGNFGAKRGV